MQKPYLSSAVKPNTFLTGKSYDKEKRLMIYGIFGLCAGYRYNY